MASETSEKVAWGLLGLAIGAGGMYVLAKEDVWKANPADMYYAIGATDMLGPYQSEDEAYDAYLAAEGIEPMQILYGHPNTPGGGIDGIVVWESDEEDEED